MSEATLLRFVLRYPHSTALARHVSHRCLYAGLRRLEARGLVRRRRGHYLLTRTGRAELETAYALTRLLAGSTATT